MLSCTLRRLDDLQDHLEPLRGADSVLLRSNDFDTRLDELDAIRVDLAHLPGVGHELARVSGALELLLGCCLYPIPTNRTARTCIACCHCWHGADPGGRDAGTGHLGSPGHTAFLRYCRGL